MDCVLQVKLVDELGEVVGIGVHVVATPWLARAAVTATIVGVVTLPGYRYSVTYYKAKGSPGLLVRYSVVKNDLRIRMTAAEFRVKAWKVAKDNCVKPRPRPAPSRLPNRYLRGLNAWFQAIGGNKLGKRYEG
jgi:hypothetical protein